MDKQPARKWFWIGFSITGILALAFLMVSQVPRGLAQNGEQNEYSDNRQALEAAADQFPASLIGEEAEIAEAQALAEYGSPWVIPAADFVSDGNVPNGFRFITLDTSNRGGYIRGTNNASTCVMAPVYLPDGATMTNLTATVVDSDSINQIVVTLYRSNKTTGFPTNLGGVSTTNAYTSPDPVSIGTNTITGPTVDNDTYTYFVATCLPAATIQLYSVRISYSQ